MKNRHPFLAIAAGIAALTALAGPAAADIWWETSEGTISWSDTVGGAAVFTLNDTSAMFFEGIPAEETSGRMYDANGWVEGWSGSFSGLWYDFDPAAQPCPQPRTDPYGRSAAAWGPVWITFSDLRNFTLTIGECNGPVQVTIIGGPGR